MGNGAAFHEASPQEQREIMKVGVTYKYYVLFLVAFNNKTHRILKIYMTMNICPN
jgi:hypothetical protein